MHKLFKSRVVAVTAGAATVVSLGAGGAVAAGMIGSNDIRNQSIRAVDIDRGSIGASELHANSVRRGHILNDTIGIRDVSTWMKREIRSGGPQGPQGEQGAQGPKGDPGAPGEDGDDGVSGYELVNAEVRWGASTGLSETVATCPGGKVVLGGGYEIDGTANGSAADTEITDNGPVYVQGLAHEWRVAGVPSGEVNVLAWVICAEIAEAD